MKYPFFLAIILGFTSLLADLEDRSPFMPYDFQKSSVGGGPPGSPELRGILDYGDGNTQFGFFSPSDKKSLWVGMKDPKSPYFVESYNPTDKTVELSLGGRKMALHLKKPSSNTLPINTAGPSQLQSPDFNRIPKSELVESEQSEPQEEAPREEMDPEKRKEMAKKVFEAFRKYVQERKAAREQEEGQ